MIPPRLCTSVPVLTRIVIAGAALLASSCATEPPPKPAHLDPANPSAPESRPLETTAPAAGTPLEAKPSQPGEDKAEHDHQHEHGAGGAP
jgi:hypothetical protein